MDPDLIRAQVSDYMTTRDDLSPMPGVSIRTRAAHPPPAAEATPAPAPTFMESMGTEMVDLYISPLSTHFRVHKSLLCTKIPYFTSMFLSSFRESLSNSASFPEDSAESFDVLLGWLYSGSLRSLAIPGDKDNQSSGIRTGVKYKTAWNPVDFYRLVDKLCMDELKDEALDALIRWCKEGRWPGLEMVGEMYRDTVAGSSIRRYGVAILRYGVVVKELGFELDAVNKLMLKTPDLMIDYLASERERPDSLDPCPFRLSCRYHCHEEGYRCSVVILREKEEEEFRAGFGFGGLRGDGYVPYQPGLAAYRNVRYPTFDEALRDGMVGLR